MLNYSTSEENHIKAIYRLQGREGTVTTNELARALNTRAASVTDMMKKLKGKKLLDYRPYRGFRLTGEGSRVALGIIRRHRLWEYFLAEKLKFSWDEVHEVAEDLEHVSSKKLIDKLDAFLGFPRIDPHGDPIPDAQGRIERSKKISLADLDSQVPATVCNVSDRSSGILEWLERRKISIGTRVEIKKRFPFDDSLELKAGKQAPFTISRQLAENIFVSLPGPKKYSKAKKENEQAQA